MRPLGPVFAMLRVAFALAAVLGFVAALLPPPEFVTVVTWQDKIEHGVFFFLMTLLGLAAWPARRSAVPAWLLLYGMAMEVAQSFTTHRLGDPADWLADALGIAVALLAVSAARRQLA